jgi:energy-coupling factor transporter transmembrane protein EcfT
MLGLAIATSLVAPWPLLLFWLVLLAWLLVRSGVAVGDLAKLLTRWWPLAVVIVAIHALTTVAAAPLGHPSWTGAGAGIVALLRVAASIFCLWLLLRSCNLADLTAAMGWWLRPLRPAGVDPVQLAVVLAVAVGTIPRAADEARRIDAVLRLRRRVDRRAAVNDGRRRDAPLVSTGDLNRRWWRRVADRGRLIVPLVEGIFRRADGMSLALAGRLPRPDTGCAGPTAGETVAMASWLLAVGLLWSAFVRAG